MKGTYEQKVPLRPLGEGKLNIRDILEEAPESIDNIIVELDNSPYDMVVSLTRSYIYMNQAGFAYGRR